MRWLVGQVTVGAFVVLPAAGWPLLGTGAVATWAVVRSSG